MSDSPQPRVLLVEDEPLIRILAADMLDALGFAVIEAGNAEEALAIDDQTLGEVVGLMVDLGLPDEPGEEVARRLRQRRSDLPVILTTGADASAARDGLAGPGPVEVLEKPYQLNDLQRAISILAPAARGVA